MVDKSAIGGTSRLGSQQTGNITYGVMPEQVTKELTNGGEFIVIQKTRQGEVAHIWTSGDPEQAKALFREGYEQMATTKEPALG